MKSKSPPAQQAKKMSKPVVKSGAQVIVDTLVDLGVETMFGYCGGVWFYPCSTSSMTPPSTSLSLVTNRAVAIWPTPMPGPRARWA